jgi:glycosyltransferase involved in cell wall biosynthesis
LTRLKILFLANRIPYPIRDGQARRTYHVLKGLGQAHEVHLLSMFETPEEAQPETRAHLQTFCHHVEMLPAPSKTPGVAMVLRLLCSLVSAEPYTIWRHYSPRFAARVRECLEGTRFDIVHCDILPIAYAVREIDRPFCSLTDHDVSHLKARRLAAVRRNPVARLFILHEAKKLERLESTVFRDVDLGIAVSDADRRLLESLCPGRPFAVVENGVDVRAFAPDPLAVEPDTLVWVGGLRDRSNLDAVRYFVEDVLPRVRRRCPRVKLCLVASGVPAGFARAIASDSSITVTGFVPDPAPYIRRAAVFVVPMLSGSGTKLKVLEAMAAGKAIVSTSIGVEGIEGRDGQHYRVADQSSAFAECVVELLNNRAMREHLGTNARRIAEQKYDWKIICSKMSRIYEEAAAAAGSEHPRAVLASGGAL